MTVFTEDICVCSLNSFGRAYVCSYVYRVSICHTSCQICTVGKDTKHRIKMGNFELQAWKPKIEFLAHNSMFAYYFSWPWLLDKLQMPLLTSGLTFLLFFLLQFFLLSSPTTPQVTLFIHFCQINFPWHLGSVSTGCDVPPMIFIAKMFFMWYYIALFAACLSHRVI